MVETLWDEFLKIIQEEVGKHVVETWFKAAHIASWSPQEEKITIGVPNQFIRNWMYDHYKGLILTHMGRILRTEALACDIVVNTKEEGVCQVVPATSLSKSASSSKRSVIIKKNDTQTIESALLEQKTLQQRTVNLNPQYQFSNFIVGKNNALGHAAAVMVSKNLGQAYNPLILYGSTGLGKTHLMHAIGNAAAEHNPRALICYQSADAFITEFITSIRSNRHQQFRDKYQRIDLLLLDDIQFLSNKEQTQEIFFHIFNRLYEQGKQIVISADSFPKDIVGLQHRLISRMEWGLVADIQMPDLETKTAILEKKAEEHDINLPPDVAQYIAEAVLSNIRELEGALIRVSAFCALSQQGLSVELAQQALAHCITEKKKKNVTLAAVANKVADYFKVSVQELKSQKRHKTVSVPRQIALYLMKKMTFSSLQTIGDFMGGRDHSTVIHAIGKVDHLLEKDEQLNQIVQKLEQELLK